MNGPQLRQRINTLYVFLVYDQAGNDVGILESRHGGEVTPFIFTDFDEAEKQYPEAERLCRKLRQSFRVVKFCGVEDCTQTRPF